LDAKPVSEVDFMRKIVIDGSNTSGFQRSALVALDGHLETNGKRIGVPTILLEEDAARKLGEAEGEVVYRLDRLGIPLVEIATTPDIKTPEEAREVALAFGSLLRATHARTPGVAGFFHSDELPAYGIIAPEVDAVRKALGTGPQDAFILVAERRTKAQAAIEEMIPRAQAAIQGVPPETREPRPDGTSAYSRPLPGKARMYPETDVPPIRVTRERLERIREHLRELFSLLKAGRFAKEALPDLLRAMARRGVRATEAIASLGVKGIARPELEAIVDAVLDESKDAIEARGEAAEKALMGKVMERVRGRADGKLVSEVLHDRLADRLRGRKKEKKGKR